MYATLPPVAFSTFRRFPSTHSRFRRASSLASGCTVTVRLPFPSAFGPTVSYTVFPAVFSNSEWISVGGFRSWPFTARRYSPSLTFTPGAVSGDRRSEVKFSPV